MKLDSKAFAKAVAIFSGGWWLVIMGFSLIFGVGQQTISTLGSYHPFFSYNWGGLVVIVIEHLIGGFILGWIFAWLYNRFCCQKEATQ